MIKAIILDDEVKGSSLLQHKLQSFSEIIEVQQIFNNPQEALLAIKGLRPDVLFLDVEMPVMNGFEFLEQIGHFEFEVIFVTAYNVYTLDALRANALDYLLKPVNPEELDAALQKLSSRIKLKKNLPQSTPTLSKGPSGRIALPTVEGIYYIKKEEIMKVEAMSNYSVFNLIDKSKIIVSKTLKEYEPLLQSDNFMRVNRSVIVNLEFVIKYKKGEGGTLELADGSEIEVSSSKKAILIERLFDN